MRTTQEIAVEIVDWLLPMSAPHREHSIAGIKEWLDEARADGMDIAANIMANAPISPAANKDVAEIHILLRQRAKCLRDGK